MNFEKELPITVVEIETGHRRSVDSLKDLLSFLEEFWDILVEDFELYGVSGKKLTFTDEDLEYLAHKVN